MYLIFYNNLSNFYEIKNSMSASVVRDFKILFFNFLDITYLHYIYVVYYNQYTCTFPNKNKVF